MAGVRPWRMVNGLCIPIPAFVPAEYSEQDENASSRLWNRLRNLGRYFKVLKCDSENRLPLLAWELECDLVTPRSASRNAMVSANVLLLNGVEKERSPPATGPAAASPAVAMTALVCRRRPDDGAARGLPDQTGFGHYWHSSRELLARLLRQPSGPSRCRIQG